MEQATTYTTEQVEFVLHQTGVLSEADRFEAARSSWTRAEVIQLALARGAGIIDVEAALEVEADRRLDLWYGIAVFGALAMGAASMAVFANLLRNPRPLGSHALFIGSAALCYGCLCLARFRRRLQARELDARFSTIRKRLQQ